MSSRIIASIVVSALVVHGSSATEWLYAPWRTAHISRPKQAAATPAPCVFCSFFSEDNDRKNLVVQRFKHVSVVLNLYPYGGGHVMVVPHQHGATLDELSRETRAELMEVTTYGARILMEALGREAFNGGFSYGKLAGNSIEHFHMHLLPRCAGDQSWVQLLSGTQVIQRDFYELYDLLKEPFAQLYRQLYESS